MKPTGRHFFTVACRWCRGTGRVPASLDGWYVDYRWQDGHETSGPYPREEAERRVRDYGDPSGTATLIGPDGQLYE